jgi:hypothetical protein
LATAARNATSRIRRDPTGGPEARFAEKGAGNAAIRLYVSLTVRSECDTPLRLVLLRALMLCLAKSYIALCKAVNIRGQGIARTRRSVNMSKQNKAFANDAKQAPTSRPQISNTPTITSTGTLAWNVRDILFRSDRTSADTSGRSTHAPKSPAKE